MREYWDYTLLEINIVLEAKTNQLKERAAQDYMLANLIGISAARMMSSDVKYPELEQAYPHLFKTAETKTVEQWEIDKMRLMEYAEAHNKKRVKQTNGE